MLDLAPQDFFSIGFHEFYHEVDVMNRHEGEGCDFFGFKEVVEIGPAIIFARKAAAILDKGRKGCRILSFSDI